MSRVRLACHLATAFLLAGALACHESPLGPSVASWGGPNGFSFKLYTNAAIFSYACIAPVTAEPLHVDSAGRFRLAIRTQGLATPGPTAVLVGRLAADSIFAGLLITPPSDTVPNAAYGLRNQLPGPISELCLQ